MRMHGQPFVPPSCTESWVGEAFALPGDNFDLAVWDSPNETTGKMTDTEIFFSFMHPDYLHNETHLSTDSLIVPNDSDIASKARSIDLKDNRLIAHIGNIFCERIMQCRGVIDGQCWALGADAVREVVEQVTNE